MSRENVFINCPFDNDYFKLLKPLFFTLIYMDFQPLIAETADSGELRLNKLKNMMEVSKYSIHDLSRMEVNSNGLPRLNMAFECGIDFGIKLSGTGVPNKKFLILDSEQFRYHKAISDLSGNDIASHKNEPEFIIKSVRNWLRRNGKAVVGYKSIWLAYADFESAYEEILSAEGYDYNDITELTFLEIIEFMQNWMSSFKSQLH
jgi:hypothetical protein